jgi:DNA-binding NarL/FixJ family response regulator
MQGSTQFRILLADDHTFFRKGIKSHISKNPELSVEGEVADGNELLLFLEKKPVDMIILDLRMPKVTGFEALNMVKRKFPQVKILICSAKEQKKDFVKAMVAGADGYLGKLESDKEVFNAIEKIRTGKKYIPPLLAAEFAGNLINGFGNSEPSPFNHLTKREQEVLQFLVKGYTSGQIADHFHLSIRTIEHHRANLLRKSKQKNSAALVNWAVRNGFNESDP